MVRRDIHSADELSPWWLAVIGVLVFLMLVLTPMPAVITNYIVVFLVMFTIVLLYHVYDGTCERCGRTCLGAAFYCESCKERVEELRE